MAGSLTITINGTSVACQAGAPLLDVLLDHGYGIYAPCAGAGKCLKCLVKVQPAAGVGEALAEKLGETAVASGIRLACKTAPVEGMSVEILAFTRSRSVLRFDRLVESWDGAVYVAIDLGSTTIISQFIGEDGGVLATLEIENPQKRFGADIISRIEYALSRSDGLATMRKLTLSAISDGVFDFLAIMGIPKSKLKGIAIAGNTTMEHIILGLPLESISLPPFAPHKTESCTLLSQNLGLAVDDVPTYIFPVAGSFIGGDTVSGIATVIERYGKDGHTLLIDVGTNTEIALIGGGRIIATSTPAGPAFEGSSISSGMRAYEGAISAFSLDPSSMKISYATIGGAKPTGICGSGIFDLVSSLVEHKVIDGEGRLLEDSAFSQRIITKPSGREIVLYRDPKRTISFTQGDLREIQLAKGAVSAAIAVLCKSARVQEYDIKRIVLLGNFGSHITKRHLISLGVTKDIEHAEVITIPDGVVAGVRATVRDIGSRARIEALATSIEVILLSGDPDFEALFIDRLNFS